MTLYWNEKDLEPCDGYAIVVTEGPPAAIKVLGYYLGDPVPQPKLRPGDILRFRIIGSTVATITATLAPDDAA